MLPGAGVSAANLHATIAGFVGHGQSYGLSCESRSAADVAAFWQISLSEADILNALPRSDDPEIGFVGDVNGAWGYIPPHAYGVHAPPIAAVLQQNGLDATARAEMPFEELTAEIDAGRPVIVWVIGAVWNGTPQTYMTTAGKQVIVAAFEHTMVMIGYDESNVTLVNAGDGKTSNYSRVAFLTSWKVLNNLAVVVKGKLSQVPPTPTMALPSATLTPTPATPQGTPPETATPPLPPQTETPDVEGTALPGEPVEEISYTVQPGDTLTDVADHFEISWQALAEYNHLPAPYVLYSGQILKIPRYTDTPYPPTPISDATPAAPTSYTVQAGDTLASLARRLHIRWQELAALNHLTYPYQLTPGQIIQIPTPLNDLS
jgi:LysM repeat protein/uncharacterized protein YvpB